MHNNNQVSAFSGRQEPIMLGPGKGRTYAMGDMTATFKADEQETDAAYSISEWWLDPGASGPGAHAHTANDDIFYVLEGTASFLLGSSWIKAPKGSFVRVAPGVTHDFRNEGQERVGLLNLYIPGGFEREMPAIVEWFKANVR